MSVRRPIRDADHLREIIGIDFTEAQMAPIIAPADRPEAIIAGAGSGKTTVMAARVVWLVGHIGVPPEQVLGLTFTNKAAAELGARIRANLATLQLAESPGADVGEPTVSTYHAFAGSLISEHGLRCGIEPDLRIVADASRYQRAVRVVTGYAGKLQHISTHVPTAVKNLLSLDSQLAEHLVPTRQLREHDAALIRELESTPVERGGLTKSLKDAAIDAAAKRRELCLLVDSYRKAKNADGVMDFSDQMAWGARLAQLPEVAGDLRSRFTTVLLDEYQDTSVAQRDLLTALFSGPTTDQGRGHPVTAVGDPAQSIYGWRGASATNLIQFLDDFPSGRATAEPSLYSLSETRRCAPEIIDVANRVAAEYYASSDAVTPLAAAPQNPSGTVTAALHTDIHQEITALTEQVISTHQEGVNWNEIGILVRTGAETSALVSALRDAGVPVEVLGLSGLLWQPAVRDVICVLELLHDVTANPSAIRLLTGPKWRIGPRDLALLGQRAAYLARIERPDNTQLQARLDEAVAGVDPSEVVSLVDAIEDPGATPLSEQASDRIGEFAHILMSLRSHIGEPLPDLARRAARALHIDVELMVANDQHAADNVAAFIDVVAEFSEHDRYASLAGLLAYLDAEAEHSDGLDLAQLPASDAVQVLTTHSAKGLEWDVVFLPSVCDTVFPSDRSRPRWVTAGDEIPVALRGDVAGLADLEVWSRTGLDEYKAATGQEALMEERRLAYVAFTRARRALHVSAHRWGRNQKTQRKVSPFLTSVADWLAEQHLEPLQWADMPADGATNPLLEAAPNVAWPAGMSGLPARQAAADVVRRWQAGSATEVPLDHADPDGLELLATIDTQLETLLREESPGQRIVQLPETLSATQVMAMLKDTQSFAQNLARPMPRRPNQAARFGTRFHAWVEDHYRRPGLFDPTDLPGRADLDVDDDDQLTEFTQKFASGPFGQREPYAIEEPFSIVVGGQQIIGRIDAIYHDRGRYEVVDFKTNRHRDADPMQLALYRLAWAELKGIDPAQVTAAFYYVRWNDVVSFDDLPERAELERRLATP